METAFDHTVNESEVAQRSEYNQDYGKDDEGEFKYEEGEEEEKADDHNEHLEQFFGD